MSKKESTTRPPADLGPEGATFWARIVSEFSLEVHHLELLHQTSIQLDRLASARKLLNAQGLFVKVRGGGLKEHPAAATERAAQRTFRALVRELGLDLEPSDGGYGRAPRLDRGAGRK